MVARDDKESHRTSLLRSGLAGWTTASLSPRSDHLRSRLVTERDEPVQIEVKGYSGYMPFPTDPQPEVPIQDPDPPEIQEPSGVTPPGGSSGESSPHPSDQPRTSESQETRTAAATTSSTTPTTTTTATGNRNAGLIPSNVRTLLEGIHVLTTYTINAQKIGATELLLIQCCVCVTFSHHLFIMHTGRPLLLPVIIVAIKVV